MENTSQFQGVSGQVAHQFIALKSFLIFIPVLIYWALFFTLIYFIAPKVSTTIFIALHLLAASFLLARFALPGKQGNFSCGLIDADLSLKDTIDYAVRYIVYTLYWLIPVIVIAKLAFNDSTMMSFLSAGSLNAGRLGGIAILSVFLLLVQLFAPPLCAILAASTDSYEELISTEPFKNLFQERLHELSSYFSAIIGGMAVFYAKYLLFFLMINLTAFQISLEAGMVITSIIYLLPYYLAPVLVGRLAGAFLWAEEDIEYSSEPIPEQDLQNSKYKLLYHNNMQRIPHMNHDKLSKMLASVLKEDQQNVYILLLAAHLYYQIREIEHAEQFGNRALKKCLDDGLNEEARLLFNKMIKHNKNAVSMDKDEFILLAGILLNQQQFMESAWCCLLAFKAGATEADEKLTIQKKFLSIADEAEKAGKTEIARGLYTLFIKNFPDSSLADFAREQL